VESRIILSDALLRGIGVQYARQMRASFLHRRIRACSELSAVAYPNETVVANLNSIPVKIQLPWENLVVSRPETSQPQLYHVVQLVASATPQVYFILLSGSHRQTHPHIPISLRPFAARWNFWSRGTFCFNHETFVLHIIQQLFINRTITYYLYEKSSIIDAFRIIKASRIEPRESMYDMLKV